MKVFLVTLRHWFASSFNHAVDHCNAVRIIVQVTHTVESGGVLKTSVHASATEKTPIMLTQHIYWNLDAFQGSDNILNHKLHVDGSKVVAVDGDAIPTGEFIDVEGTPYDFSETQAIGARWNDTVGLCGGGAWPPVWLQWR